MSCVRAFVGIKLTSDFVGLDFHVTYAIEYWIRLPTFYDDFPLPSFSPRQLFNYIHIQSFQGLDMTSALPAFPTHNSTISLSQKSLLLSSSELCIPADIYFVCLVIWVAYKLCTSVHVPVPRSQNYSEFGKNQLTVDVECGASSAE